MPVFCCSIPVFCCNMHVYCSVCVLVVVCVIDGCSVYVFVVVHVPTNGAAGETEALL